MPLAAPAQHIAERLLSETSTSWRASVPTPGLQPIARRSDFSHFLAIILHLDLKVDFELSIDKGRHCAAASSLHSRPAQFAKVCRGHFQLLKQRNEVFAELVLPRRFSRASVAAIASAVIYSADKVPFDLADGLLCSRL